jgi:hypothetical protein
VPTDVSGLMSVVAVVAAGGYHTCALLAAGGVKCWGGNTLEQLGDGTTATRLTPVYVVGFGVEYCFVPYVEQNGRPAAVRKIRAAGCAPTVRLVYSSLFRKGRVIEQTPYAGTRLGLGGKVRLVVSNGRKKRRRG